MAVFVARYASNLCFSRLSGEPVVSVRSGPFSDIRAAGRLVARTNVRKDRNSQMVDVDSIRNTIRQSVNRITGISPSEIHDVSDYRADLGLDSLSALEVMVDIEYAYKIKVSEERFQSIRTVEDTIQAVQEYLSAAQA